MTVTKFSDLLGRTLVHASVSEGKDEVLIETSQGERFRLCHRQDCCESVLVEDVAGDLDGLLGEPLVMAEEVTESAGDTEYTSGTWTFYKFANAREYVTIRWLGESNGYYSESVSLERWDPESESWVDVKFEAWHRTQLAALQETGE